MTQQQLEDNQVNLSRYDTSDIAEGKTAQAVQQGILEAQTYADRQDRATLEAAKEYTRTELQKLPFLKFVETLPETGESNCLYAVVQEERTPNDEAIVLLFIWTGKEWATVGIMSGAVDAVIFEPMVKACQTAAEEAQTAKTDAQTAAAQAQSALAQTTLDADNAQASAQSAQIFAQAANESKESASSDAQSAQVFAQAANESQQNAASAAQSAQTNAEIALSSVTKVQEAAALAKRWAIETEEEVETGQGYGAKKYAMDAAEYAQKWEARISNCLTKVPQDIKWELSNGILTIKSGSQIYIPSGPDNFEVITLDVDVVVAQSGTGFGMFAFNAAERIMESFPLSSISSAAEAPNTDYSFWLDRQNNKCKLLKGGIWHENYSLPLGIFANNENLVTDVLNIFNGFGYVGSSIFVLPGVEGLIPDGRKPDGTLNNKIIKRTKVSIMDIDSNWTRQTLFLRNDINIDWFPMQANQIVFDSHKNKWIDKRTNEQVSWVPFGKSAAKSGIITDFYPYSPLRVVNYYDADFVVDKYSDDAGNWYEVWQSGKIRQGGIFTNSSSVNAASITVSLLRPFRDTNYTLVGTPSRGTVVNTSTSIMSGSHSKTVSSFAFTWLGVQAADTVQFLNWIAEGQGA